ncbi:MAG: hypothetical protein QOJ17_259 [Rhodospirillaceae bacterium]|jgi:hypothetical protein|nr:hypothetical protein [Rhodospirillaceae bacterium]
MPSACALSSLSSALRRSVMSLLVSRIAAGHLVQIKLGVPINERGTDEISFTPSTSCLR